MNVLDTIREFISSPEPMTDVRIGSVGAVKIPTDLLTRTKIYPVEENLRLAEQEGVKPVSMQDIISQFDAAQLARAVFFDQRPSNCSFGNFWRIASPAPENPDHIMLQFCNSFGQDIIQIPPVTVSKNDILFTGMSIESYALDGKDATLEEVNTLLRSEKKKENYTFPKNRLSYGEDAQYFADAQGKLTTAWSPSVG